VFTGIVQERGEILAVEPSGDGVRVSVRAPLVTRDAAHGASIAVDGVCLTVASRQADVFTADVMPETLRRTTLGALSPGDQVNLERAVPAGGRLDGHVVQGHVDGTGTVLERTPGDRWDVLRIGLAPALARYVAEKGSIAVDGVSLTVTEVDDASFAVALIPTTLELTTLGDAWPGTRVNLEVDVIAKYVDRLLHHREPTTEEPTA
jgi:riboflavin synthase